MEENKEIENHKEKVLMIHAKNREKYKCDACNVTFVCKSHHKIHNNCDKHKKNIGLISDKPKEINYCCEKCDKSFIFKSLYDKHLLQISHLKKVNTDLTDKDCKICNKTFCSRSAYEIHTKSKKHIRKMKSQN